MIAYHELFLGTACENQCVSCTYQKGPEFESLQSLVEQLDRFRPGENVLFVGGEPTLHPDFFSLVDYARKKGAKRIKIATNGIRLADAVFLEKLIQGGCRLFELKFYGSNPQSHERVTRVKGSFEATFEGLKNLVDFVYSEAYESQIYLAARIGITQLNIEDLVHTVGFLASSGIDRIILMRQGTDFNMTNAAGAVAQAIQFATLNRLWCVCEGFPPCLMAGSEFHLTSLLQPKLSGREKPKSCASCTYASICNGPPQGYIKKHGGDEFKAMSSSLYMKDVIHLLPKNNEKDD